MAKVTAKQRAKLPPALVKAMEKGKTGAVKPAAKKASSSRKK